MKLKYVCAAAAAITAAGCAQAAEICTPQEFGGYTSTIHVNTDAIQQAIDKCSQAGGGEVRLSKGLWLSGPIKLKSNVTLNLMDGALLKADNSEKKFIAAYIGHPTQDNEAFILADGADNVAVIGRGTIDGSGAELWWKEALEVRAAVRSGNAAVFEERFPGVKLANGMPRPWLIEFNNVTNGMVHSVTLKNSPMWNLVIRNSKQVGAEQIAIEAPEDSPNTDGIDIVSSQSVHIKDVTIHTGDDNIAIKSGVDQDGAAPSADILIEDSTMLSGHGLSIGSETANGIGSVTVRNVFFKDGMNGVRIKSARDRGNQIGPLYVEDVTMEGVDTPILVTLSYAGNAGAAGLGLVEPIEEEPVTATTPFVKGVHIKNLKATGADIAALISGLPESPIKDVLLENVQIDSRLGVQARYAEGSVIMSTIKAAEGTPIERGPDARIKEAR